jgi:hypothetical protein
MLIGVGGPVSDCGGKGNASLWKVKHMLTNCWLSVTSLLDVDNSWKDSPNSSTTIHSLSESAF